MTGGYLYCQVMRTSFPCSGINRYSRPDLAFPNCSLPSPSLLFLSLVCFPVSHHFLLLSFMSFHSLPPLLCLYACPPFCTLFISHSFFLLASPMLILSISTFSLSRKWSYWHFRPLELYRHIIVMYHPPNTCPVPVNPSHCRHFDLSTTSVTVIMSQGSGIVHAGSLVWFSGTPTQNGTITITSHAWAFHNMTSHSIVQSAVRKVYRGHFFCLLNLTNIGL